MGSSSRDTKDRGRSSAAGASYYEYPEEASQRRNTHGRGEDLSDCVGLHIYSKVSRCVPHR